MSDHSYVTTVAWRGSTAAGYQHYDRTHSVDMAGKGTIPLTADSGFLGNGQSPNPEELLLAAASSCQLLSFLAVAARARVDVIAYGDVANASMPEGNSPMRITEIHLYPVIEVADGTNIDSLPRLVRIAHQECFIAASLKSRMTIHASVRMAGSQVASFDVG